MKPISNYILIEPETPEEKTKGGLYRPESGKERPVKGRAIAVGPGQAANNGTLIPMQVTVGDLVLYGQFAGTEVKVDGKDLLMIRESEAMAIL